MSKKRDKKSKHSKNHDSEHEEEKHEDENIEEESKHENKHKGHKKHKSSKINSKKRKIHHTPSKPNFNVWFWVSMALIVALVFMLTYSPNTNEETNFIEEIDDLMTQTTDTNLRAALESLKNDATEVEKKLIDIKDEISDSKSKETNKEEEKLQEENTGSAGNTDETVSMEFYVMSQCPYGTEVVDAIAPVKKELGDNLDLHIEYIFYPRSQYAGQESTFCVEEYCGMHGVPEVQGNFVQLCAIEHEPEKYLDMLVCMNKNAQAIPNNWEQCAKDNNLDVEKIRTCYEGEEAFKLAEETQQKADAKQAKGSPTIFMNDLPYSGGRTEMDFMRAICNEFEEKPSACAKIPEPVKVDLIVLNDETCSSCDDGQIIMVSKQLFPGVQVERIDVTSEEGKELIEEFNVELAPAYFFSEKVTETETWTTQPQIQAAFQKVGDMYKLLDSQTGANYYISEEKRLESEEKKLEMMGLNEGMKPKFYFFWSETCPHCKNQKPYVEEWQTKYPEIDFQIYEMSQDPEGSKLYSEIAILFGTQAGGVPATFVGDKHWIGFNEVMVEEMEDAIKAVIN
jgi:thiol-disulfide isomerase/thioredoxin